MNRFCSQEEGFRTERASEPLGPRGWGTGFGGMKILGEICWWELRN